MSVERKEWQQPEIEELGNVAQLVQQGTGKTVVLAGDSGEPLKNPNNEPS